MLQKRHISIKYTNFIQGNDFRATGAYTLLFLLFYVIAWPSLSSPIYKRSSGYRNKSLFNFNFLSKSDYQKIVITIRSPFIGALTPCGTLGSNMAISPARSLIINMLPSWSYRYRQSRSSSHCLMHRICNDLKRGHKVTCSTQT